MPVFGPEGRVVSYEVGDCSALMRTVHELVRRGHKLDAVLPAFTRTAGALLRFETGMVAVGRRDDVVMF